jgi:hypothetical protein
MFCQVGSNVGMSLESKLPADDSGITKSEKPINFIFKCCGKSKMNVK